VSLFAPDIPQTDLAAVAGEALALSVSVRVVADLLGEALVAHLAGTVGLGNVNDLRTSLKRLVSSRSGVLVLDIGELRFDGASGPAALHAVAQACRREGRALYVCGATRPRHDALAKMRLTVFYAPAGGPPSIRETT
jgi:anti-anti-sigma regulatory factor